MQSGPPLTSSTTGEKLRAKLLLRESIVGTACLNKECLDDGDAAGFRRSRGSETAVPATTPGTFRGASVSLFSIVASLHFA